jgi:phospholipid/cholesterol/gamma-HCH transport system permease protein
MVCFLGRVTLSAIRCCGDFVLFTARGFSGVWQTRRLWGRFVRALFELGVRCLPVILIVGVFTGLVLGLQGYYVLNRFGSESLLGALVSLSLVRELGPVLAALMLVGQAGSALAAELGIQRNSEQISALETLGINSHGYLITPRFLAGLVVYPMQTALFVSVGLWGGWLSGSLLLGLETPLYWSAVERAVQLADVLECFIKALTFAVLTLALCCYQGFHADRSRVVTGARAVSAATTRAVVLSCIAVLAADYIITSFLV